jgi:germination protein M
MKSRLGRVLVGGALLAGLVSPVRALPSPAQAATTQAATVATANTKPLALKVYFMRNDKLVVAGRTVPTTKAVGRAALLQLLAGPSPADKARGMATCVPARTKLLGLSVAHGTATVDLSKSFARGGGSLSMTARLAQVVYTLTQFPTVSRVVFWMEGRRVTVFGGEGIMLDHPATRASFEYLTPAILVETPTPGQSVSSPVGVSGTANVFEADFWAELTASSGKVISKRHVHASSGTGTRGAFSALLYYSSPTRQKGTLVAYDLSPKDGHRENVVRVPLTLSRS